MPMGVSPGLRFLCSSGRAPQTHRIDAGGVKPYFLHTTLLTGPLTRTRHLTTAGNWLLLIPSLFHWQHTRALWAGDTSRTWTIKRKGDGQKR